VALAQARFRAGILAGSRVSEARIPALKEHLETVMLKGQYIDATLQLTSALGAAIITAKDALSILISLLFFRR
jgi:outer membrane protein TolC